MITNKINIRFKSMKFWCIIILLPIFSCSIMLGCTDIFAETAGFPTERRNLAIYNVKLQLKWIHQYQFAGYYAALSKGYYSEEGLNVTIIEGSPEINPVEEVVNGNAEFGIGNSELIVYRSRGKKIKLLSAVFQHSPEVLITLKSSKIINPHQLKGKKVMVEKDINGTIIKSVIQSEGIDLSSVTFIDHTFDINDLIDKKVDAIHSYITNEPFQFASKGIEVNIFQPAAYGMDFYGDCIFADEAFVENNHFIADSFIRASAKGWTYALNNKDEMIDLIQKSYNPSKTRDGLEFEYNHIRNLIYPDIIEIGHINVNRLEKIQDAYENLGYIVERVNISDFVYRQYEKNSNSNLLNYLIISGSTVLLFGFIVIMLYLYNRKLKHEVICRKTAEDKAENALRTRSDFLAAMSHEIRTPLNAIIGMTDLFFLTDNESEKFDYLITVKESSKHLLEIVNDILDFSKLEARKIELGRNNFNLKKLIDGTVEIFEFKLKEKKLTFIKDYDNEISEWVIGDSMRLKQVLINLISNAVKFTESGDIALSVHKKIINDDMFDFQFQIRDTGIGIPSDKIEEVFNQFFQVHANITRKYGGTGLGLSIVNTLIKLMGGDIKVESEEGKGSIFRFNIPLQKGSKKEKKNKEDNLLAASTHFRVLLAEDNLINTKLAVIVLEKLGHVVTPVTNGFEVIEELKRNIFDLILMDIEMPDMDGFEATIRIRKGDAGESNRDIPIVAMTAHATSDIKDKCMKIGMNDYISKPIDISDINPVILKVTNDN